jgi:hypothetical protein
MEIEGWNYWSFLIAICFVDINGVEGLVGGTSKGTMFFIAFLGFIVGTCGDMGSFVKLTW